MPPILNGFFLWAAMVNFHEFLGVLFSYFMHVFLRRTFVHMIVPHQKTRKNKVMQIHFLSGFTGLTQKKQLIFAS